MAEPLAAMPARCVRCASELAPTLLACPACGALVHGAELKELAAAATAATGAGDVTAALTAWRRALDLLPAQTRQHGEIASRVQALSRAIDAPAPATSPHAPSAHASSASAPSAHPTATVSKRGWKLGGGAAGAALLGLLGKGKLLLFGLTKLTTLGSMALAFGLYLTLWSWKFALGFVASIYVHEMGHVFALRRYGIAATAPMFIPGLGALVRLKQHPATVAEDANVGLAGPIWGLGAALAAFAVGLAGGGAIWTAIAQAAGLLNLFNLMPLGPLDGGRAFNALSRPQRYLMSMALIAAWLLTRNGVVLLVFFVALGRTFGAHAPEKPNWKIAVEYLVLVAALTYLAALPVPAAR
ncbi:MAG: peptidase [Myxococcales bacterium]|nr:peptidase [Myxococcales bacterium]